MCHIANRKEEDVNAICYSKENPNLVFSGGDDGILTCWDSRLFGSPDSPVGYLGKIFIQNFRAFIKFGCKNRPVHTVVFSWAQ